MLTIIEALLSPDEAAAMFARLKAADWRDGAASAGARSVAVKQNLQTRRDDPLGQEPGAAILRKLGGHMNSYRRRWPRRSDLRFSISIRTPAITARIPTPR